MQLMYLVAQLSPDPVEEPTLRTESAFGKVRKMLNGMGVLCKWVKL